MSEVAAELATRFRVSDPKPSHCAACFRGADETVKFIDLDAAIDRGSLQDHDGWTLAGIDDLHLCEACVRAAGEVLALKPQLHARQLREIRRLELRVESLTDYIRSLERTLKDRPE